jgi:hypothetical protein
VIDRHPLHYKQLVDGLYHVFDLDYRSLCGRVMMLKIDPRQVDQVVGTEKYKKGQDCKACFKKAGLQV